MFSAWSWLAWVSAMASRTLRYLAKNPYFSLYLSREGERFIQTVAYNLSSHLLISLTAKVRSFNLFSLERFHWVIYSSILLRWVRRTLGLLTSSAKVKREAKTSNLRLSSFPKLLKRIASNLNLRPTEASVALETDWTNSLIEFNCWDLSWILLISKAKM